MNGRSTLSRYNRPSSRFPKRTSTTPLQQQQQQQQQQPQKSKTLVSTTKYNTQKPTQKVEKEPKSKTPVSTTKYNTQKPIRRVEKEPSPLGLFLNAIGEGGSNSDTYQNATPELCTMAKEWFRIVEAQRSRQRTEHRDLEIPESLDLVCATFDPKCIALEVAAIAEIVKIQHRRRQHQPPAPKPQRKRTNFRSRLIKPPLPRRPRQLST